MRAWNKRKRQKHWTKPKWHKRTLFSETFYVLKTIFMKEKVNVRGLELRNTIINNCFFNKVKRLFF